MLNFVALVSAPVEMEFSLLQTATRTRQGTHYWCVEMASLHRLEHLCGVVECLFSEATHRQCGLTLTNLPGCDFTVEETQALANMYVMYVGNLLSREYQFALLYHSNLPMRLAGFLSSDEATRRATGTFCLRLWHALQWLEKSSMCVGICEQLQWPLAPWPMEMLLGVVEGDGCCPADCLEEISDMIQYRGTELIENLFKLSRKTMKVDSLARASPELQWQRILASGVSEDFDCPMVPLTDEDRDSTLPFPTEMFKDDKCVFFHGARRTCQHDEAHCH